LILIAHERAIHNTTDFWYSPNTRRSASDISPTVANASAAPQITGIRLAPDDVDQLHSLPQFLNRL
jgi:hypothetical protein